MNSIRGIKAAMCAALGAIAFAAALGQSDAAAAEGPATLVSLGELSPGMVVRDIALPSSIVAAGLRNVNPAPLDPADVSVDTRDGDTRGESTTTCSTWALDGPLAGPVCSIETQTVDGLPGPGFGIICTAFHRMGGGLTVTCSSQAQSGYGTAHKCSVNTNSPSRSHACSTGDHASAGGTGTAQCSAVGTPSSGNNGAECSVTKGESGDSCSTTSSSGSGSHCSTADGGSSNQQCSVQAGSGATCTTGTANSGSATCSAQSGTNSNCSSHDGNTEGMSGNGQNTVGAFTGNTTPPDANGNCN